MNLFICDDELSTLNFLKKIITEHYGDEHTVFTFSDIKTMLNSGETANILISDIKLDDKNGIDGATELLKKSPDTKVIFFTAYPMEYFEDIFKNFRPFGFIGKPINENLLFNHIDNIVEQSTIKETLEFTLKGLTYCLPLNNIIYIESHGRQKFIFTESDTYIYNISFDKIISKLNSDFSRSHIAYIVNLRYVSKIINNGCLLTNNKIIPISRKYKSSLQASFFIFKESHQV